MPTDGADDTATLEERFSVYRDLILSLYTRASSSPTSSPASSDTNSSHLPVFALDQPMVLIASPGRDRLMMGHVSPLHAPLPSLHPFLPLPPLSPASHPLPLLSSPHVQTDFGGLGGFTIDCATREELLCVAQLTSTSAVELHNGNPTLFSTSCIPLSSLLSVASNPSAYGQANWPTSSWSAYVSAALTYMLSPRFPSSATLLSSLSTRGVRYFVCSPGRLSLPHTGGVSSSAALTGAVSMSLSHLLFPSSPLPLSLLASVDYGEYYLGKFAGCADKMAQLYAQRGTVTVIGSKPERWMGGLRFPAGLGLLIAEGAMPRLTLPEGGEWLMGEGLEEERVQEVLTWARSVMVRFGSVVYSRAAELIVQQVEASAASIGLSADEATAVKQAMLGHRRTGEKPEEGRGGPLLRELCSGGLLEDWLPALAGWDKRLARYALIYRLLRLLPIKLPHMHQGVEYELHPRKAALYGISEVERGTAYLRELGRINELARHGGQGDDMDEAVRRVISYVELSHDGDRAVVDFRHPAPASPPHLPHLSRHDGPFLPTPWASHPSVSVSDADLSAFISQPADLLAAVGSYERSVVSVDEACDELKAAWEGKAAGRISAAGMGARLGVHCRAEVLEEVRQWLEKRGWKCRQPQPGAPTQHIAFT